MPNPDCGRWPWWQSWTTGAHKRSGFTFSRTKAGSIPVTCRASMTLTFTRWCGRSQFLGILKSVKLRVRLWSCAHSWICVVGRARQMHAFTRTVDENKEGAQVSKTRQQITPAEADVYCRANAWTHTHVGVCVAGNLCVYRYHAVYGWQVWLYLSKAWEVTEFGLRPHERCQRYTPCAPPEGSDDT